jgi:hypothetical protein
MAQNDVGAQDGTSGVGGDGHTQTPLDGMFAKIAQMTGQDKSAVAQEFKQNPSAFASKYKDAIAKAGLSSEEADALQKAVSGQTNTGLDGQFSENSYSNTDPTNGGLPPPPVNAVTAANFLSGQGLFANRA